MTMCLDFFFIPLGHCGQFCLKIVFVDRTHLHNYTLKRVFLTCLCIYMLPRHHYNQHHHLSLNHEGGRGTADDFKASFLHFCIYSTALRDLANSRPVLSLMLSSHLFLCLPCLLPSFTVPCKMVLARPNQPETWPYYCSLHLFTIFRRSSCGQVACWILAPISLLVTYQAG